MHSGQRSCHLPKLGNRCRLDCQTSYLSCRYHIGFDPDGRIETMYIRFSGMTRRKSVVLPSLLQVTRPPSNLLRVLAHSNGESTRCAPNSNSCRPPRALNVPASLSSSTRSANRFWASRWFTSIARGVNSSYELPRQATRRKGGTFHWCDSPQKVLCGLTKTGRRAG